jgi:hypothetical protein
VTAAAAERGGQAPVSPPPESGAAKPRRKPPNRGKAGGRKGCIAVWVSDAEKAAIEERATAAGLSVSSYLRAAATGETGPGARRRPTVDRQLLGQAVAELNRVGNNVNQIARAGNIGKDIDPGFYAATGDELRRTLARVMEAFAT